MFSKELEEIIEAALADGVITDKERAVLHKRAIADGVDPDELDVVIDGRLAKRKAEKESLKATAPQPQSNKHGELKKCPHCGAVVEAGNPTCEDCGYAFSGLKANSSRKKLQATLSEIEMRHSINPLSIFFPQRIWEIDGAIKGFPIPTTKEDLLEFLLYLKPLTRKTDRNLNWEAYRFKYEECLNKAELFFSDDPLFQRFLKKKEEEKPKGFFGKLFGKK